MNAAPARYTPTPRLIALLLLLALPLTLIACGGDDDDGGDNGDSPTQSDSADNGEPTEAADAGDDEPSDDSDANGDEPDDGGSDSGSTAGENMAVVTIGDRRYEFAMTGTLESDDTVSIGQCLTLFGVIGGGGYAPDGSDITLSIEIPPEDWETSDEDWEPPSIRISDDEEDLDWRAGGDIVMDLQGVEPGTSQVDSFSNDGTTASGTATFIEVYAVLRGEEPEPIEGTFEISCSDE